jgi:hypothetical protein
MLSLRLELLLSKGADVNAQGGQHGNALQAASLGGHDKVVELLLSKGADVNAQGGQYGNALQAASLGGHDKVVELLLSKGADVNAQGGEYGNALQGGIAGRPRLVHVRCLASSERLHLLISLHHPLFAFYCLLKLGLSSEEKGRCSNA